jgi:hypothetical protein
VVQTGAPPAAERRPEGAGDQDAPPAGANDPRPPRR